MNNPQIPSGDDLFVGPAREDTEKQRKKGTAGTDAESRRTKDDG